MQNWTNFNVWSWRKEQTFVYLLMHHCNLMPDSEDWCWQAGLSRGTSCNCARVRIKSNAIWQLPDCILLLMAFLQKRKIFSLFSFRLCFQMCFSWRCPLWFDVQVWCRVSYNQIITALRKDNAMVCSWGSLLFHIPVRWLIINPGSGFEFMRLKTPQSSKHRPAIHNSLSSF